MYFCVFVYMAGSWAFSPILRKYYYYIFFFKKNMKYVSECRDSLTVERTLCCSNTALWLAKTNFSLHLISKSQKTFKKKNTKYFFHVATYEQTFPWKSKIYLQLFFWKNIIFILTCRDSSLSPNDKAYISFQLYLSQLVEKVCLRSYVQRAASLYMKKNILYSFDIFTS